jgi:hypothetical protein
MVLYRQVLLAAGPAAAIASAADAIESEPPPSGSISCPSDIFSVTTLGFSYRGGNQAALAWGDSGCEVVDNGNLAAFQLNPGFAAFQHAVNIIAPPQLHQEG